MKVIVRNESLLEVTVYNPSFYNYVKIPAKGRVELPVRCEADYEFLRSSYRVFGVTADKVSEPVASKKISEPVSTKEVITPVVSEKPKKTVTRKKVTL